ncbi:MAG TPA: low affinity iron permease family protein [Gaiellaceae bacterium]|nr:low affinity iron permease family protein [Gaiellaceae bacterium]
MRLIRRIATKTPEVVGSPWAFLTAILLTVFWIVWGFFAAFSDTWLLVPSAVASVVTFLIVFSLQYTQNRDTRAIQLKLDEILRGTERARSDLVKLERRSDEELTQIEDEIVRLREEEAENDAA